MNSLVEGVLQAADVVLYRNDRTVITRRAGGIVCKQAIGAEAAQRLRHEQGILERLAGVAGVVQLARVPVPAHTLALRDEGGRTLSEVKTGYRDDLAGLVGLGHALARVLADVHRRGVVHKDLNPANILVHGPGRAPTLIDFNIASCTAEERPGFMHQSQIAGTLHYMAPEQTGRTGRPVDLRADLYSLGVVLYELAVGRLPFEADDLLDLIHHHLAQVPTPPAQCRPQIPPMLSDLIMRLLEKEPDRRYQSADGVRQDLERLLRGEAGAFALGEHDFAQRLVPPSRPVGRAALLARLQQAVDDRLPSLCLTGAPGVGKSALISELRAMVAARRGWFVASRFDPYRQDARRASVEALRALGRLLLAEPEDRLVRQRERLLKGLGANVGFGPALLPEFVLLLGPQPRVEISDPREAETRMIQTGVDLLRSIADPARPVVMVFDDLQAAPAMPLRFFDALVTCPDPIPGLLLVGAYRSNEVDAAHPLSAMRARWQQLGVAPPCLHLDNLAPADTGVLIGAMLRLPADAAAPLATVLHECTDGNPCDTVELVNALRDDGLLSQADGRWHWDAAALRRHVGPAGMADVLGRRLARLGDATRQVLEAMACLAGAVAPDLLALVAGLGAEELADGLAVALEEGLLVAEPGSSTALRLRHDRVQQAVIGAMGPARRARQHLQLARRLVARPELRLLAAEQYLPVAHALTDAAECRHAAGLFHHAAAGSRVLNYAVSERFLAAALQVLAPWAGTPADAQWLHTLEVERHAALYGLGRCDEADAVYARIVARCRDPLALAGPAGIQMYSLIHRMRYQEALELGLALLSELGQDKPDPIGPAIEAGLQRLAGWAHDGSSRADVERAEADDPRVLARARVGVQTANAGFFCDPAVFAWLVLEAQRLWDAHGPCPALMSGSSGAPILLAGVAQDYRGAYRMSRHLITVGEARGYRHGAAMARCNFGLAVGHWAEPVEHMVTELRQAREELLQAGDVTYAAYTYMAVDALLDCAPVLDAAAAELEAGLAFFERAGNAGFRRRYLPRRQLIRALRGETHAPGGLCDDSFDDAPYETHPGGPAALSSTYPLVRAMAAAVFGDAEGLAVHAARAMASLSGTPGYYVSALARVWHALALAEQARTRPAADRAALLAELDRRCLRWLARRAEDAPLNFLHLQRWIEAERAWAAGELWQAGAAFDTAMQAASQRMRPWHQALITERAALFHLALGLQDSGQCLLSRACDAYAAWGAEGKVREMRRQHASLRSGRGLQRGNDSLRSTVVASDVVDMMAVLRASQALSSETHLGRLTECLGQVVRAMTGATAVQLLVRPDDGERWFLADSLEAGTGAVSVEAAGERGELALSVVRYAQRTRQTLVLDDATGDERFACDPYFAALDACSLLCAPILSHGELRGLLMLESRQRRGAFSADRLDSLMLIAGQMSVSLHNALLYASLERKVAERTAALEAANLRLEQLSRTDALTGLANRRCFDAALEAEYLRSRRTGLPLGLVMIDIDFFKAYNDQHGHPGGDACLQQVAAVLASGRRGAGDLAARYGGEEFVILLPNTGLDGACATAERLRGAVQALGLPHGPSPFGRVTISVGVAAWVASADGAPAQWVALADAALYEAKRGGRNRVVAGPVPAQAQRSTG